MGAGTVHLLRPLTDTRRASPLLTPHRGSPEAPVQWGSRPPLSRGRGASHRRAAASRRRHQGVAVHVDLLDQGPRDGASPAAVTRSSCASSSRCGDSSPGAITPDLPIATASVPGDVHVARLEPLRVPPGSAAAPAGAHPPVAAGGVQQVCAVRVQGVVELCADVAPAGDQQQPERAASRHPAGNTTRESTVENDRVPVEDRRSRTSSAEELA